ncbi:hypothetical protein FHX42_005248 [Saccharopolyspora lacisalsi]|uniref:DUF2637 domain-containing protein n=1 Tax=Halosaccharopolyspora lacisalsi TaxID=1000566 RepID=A0A839E9A1_9PSEU|nr:hypothetical protein [Halosaccharopolyspora lacisalsi]MBA8827841.1 hypothetical protein [Halosaccharopolyspora lacisalsi]
MSTNGSATLDRVPGSGSAVLLGPALPAPDPVEDTDVDADVTATAEQHQAEPEPEPELPADVAVPDGSKVTPEPLPEPDPVPATTGTADEWQPAPGSKAETIAEKRRQRRKDADARFERRQARKAARTRGEWNTWYDKSLARIKAAPDNILGSLSGMTFVSALIGSGLGQLSYWSTKFPFAVAIFFALTFEFGMVGMSRKARLRREQQASATAMRGLSWCAALGAGALNFFHLSDPAVVVRFAWINGGKPLFHGSPALGTSFAAITAIGFLVHEVSEYYHVTDRLRAAAKISEPKPIGFGRWVFYSDHAWRTKKLLIDQPTLTVEQAWERTRKPRPARPGARVGYAIGRKVGGKRIKVAPPTPVGKAAPAKQSTAGTAGPSDHPETPPAESNTEQTGPTLRAVESTLKGRSAQRKQKSRRKGRTSKVDYLAAAREHFANLPDGAITVGTVVEAVGCARSTASGIANDLKAERQSA